MDLLIAISYMIGLLGAIPSLIWLTLAVLVSGTKHRIKIKTPAVMTLIFLGLLFGPAIINATVTTLSG